jgi:hypothetical protein
LSDAKAREWDTVKPDLEVYRFSGSQIKEDPRQNEDYKKQVLEVLSIATEEALKARYPYLNSEEQDALLFVVRRGAAAFWVQGSPRTTVRFMAHDTIPTGPPVKIHPHRLSQEDNQWVEDKILEEVRRGQLERGLSEWGSPPFPTKEMPGHKRSRKRRLVVDYRRVNQRTARALYYVRRADDIKQECAGSLWYTFLDACSGFNQLPNTERARTMLAIISRSGQYLPRCLTFGPHNGPEDFSYAVDRIFSPASGSAKRRFCQEWHAYADDITIRTGRLVDGVAMTDTEHSDRVRKATEKNKAASSIQSAQDALEQCGYAASAVGSEQRS